MLLFGSTILSPTLSHPVRGILRESSAEIRSGTHNVRQTRLYGGDYSGRRDGGAVSPVADIVTICTAASLREKTRVTRACFSLSKYYYYLSRKGRVFIAPYTPPTYVRVHFSQELN